MCNLLLSCAEIKMIVARIAMMTWVCPSSLIFRKQKKPLQKILKEDKAKKKSTYLKRKGEKKKKQKEKKRE